MYEDALYQIIAFSYFPSAVTAAGKKDQINMLKTESKQIHIKHYIYLHIILTQYNIYQKVHIFWS